MALLRGTFLQKSGPAFAGRPWRRPDGWMGWIWEDHARPAPLRCLGECCSNQQKHAGSPGSAAWAELDGRQAAPAGLRLSTVCLGQGLCKRLGGEQSPAGETRTSVNASFCTSRVQAV